MNSRKFYVTEQMEWLKFHKKLSLLEYELTVADIRFLRRGAPTSKVGASVHYFAKFFPKTAWKWKKLDPKGRAF